MLWRAAPWAALPWPSSAGLLKLTVAQAWRPGPTRARLQLLPHSGPSSSTQAIQLEPPTKRSATHVQPRC